MTPPLLETLVVASMLNKDADPSKVAPQQQPEAAPFVVGGAAPLAFVDDRESVFARIEEDLGAAVTQAEQDVARSLDTLKLLRSRLDELRKERSAAMRAVAGHATAPMAPTNIRND